MHAKNSYFLGAADDTYIDLAILVIVPISEYLSLQKGERRNKGGQMQCNAMQCGPCGHNCTL